jgi:hypothetical protein
MSSRASRTAAIIAAAITIVLANRSSLRRSCSSRAIAASSRPSLASHPRDLARKSCDSTGAGMFWLHSSQEITNG